VTGLDLLKETTGQKRILCQNYSMYVIAVIGDVLGAIPIVNIVSDAGTALALFIAGAETGVSIYGSKGISKTLIAALVKAIPGVSIVPAWTIRVYLAKRQAREAKG
jgi:hypothetical protein